MKTNKILVLVAFVIVFLMGTMVGLNIKNIRDNEDPIIVNPLSKSCQYNNKTYKSGEGFPSEDGCNSCSCDNGNVACTLMACER